MYQSYLRFSTTGISKTEDLACIFKNFFSHSALFKKKQKTVYSFMGVLGLCCHVGFSSVVTSECYSLVGVCELLTVVASDVAEHGLQGMWALEVAACGLRSCGSWALGHRLSSCGTQAQLPRHVGSSEIRDQTCVSCIARWISHS